MHVRPRPRTDGRIESESGVRSLALDRTQRSVLQRLVIDLELGDWAADGFKLDPEDPEEQSARRRRVECAFWLLDDLGWHTDDPRDSFVVHVRDEGALVGALRQWRDWQIQAIEDVRRDRRRASRSCGRPLSSSRRPSGWPSSPTCSAACRTSGSAPSAASER